MSLRRSGALGGLVAALAACTCDAPPDTAAPDAAAADAATVLPEIGGAFTRLDPADGGPPLIVQAGTLGVDEPKETVGIMGDLDGDDRPEVVLSSELDGPIRMTPGMAVARVYRYDGHGLVPAADLQDIVQPAHDAVAAVLDLDGDGLTDILYAAFGSTSWMRGTAPGRYGPLQALGIAPFGGYPMARAGAIALYDLDEDGWLDIVGTAANCMTAYSALAYLRTGPAQFDAFTGFFRGALSDPTAIGAWPGPSGPLLTVMGHPCDPDHAHPGFYHRTGIDERGYPQFDPYDPTPADAAYHAYASHTGPMSLATPMGSALADLDGDGLPDLLVSLTTPQLAYFPGTPTEALGDRSLAGALYSPMGHNGNFQIPWGIVTMDFDRDGWMDVLAAEGDDVTSYMERTIGPQTTRGWWNQRNGLFRDITAQIGIAHPGHWHALNQGDLDRDGDPDVVVGGFGFAPETWRNDLRVPGTSTALRLRGTTSNHLGIGTVVEVETPGAARSVQVHGAAAEIGAHSEPLVFLAGGTDTRLRTVRLRWPSGFIQEIHDVATGGLVTVTEPWTIRVAPEQRHVASGGMDSAYIAVLPRDRDGAPREATVSIEVVHGTGSVSTPIVRDAGAYLRGIRSPMSPGSAVVEVRIDGVALGVRPRIFWD